MLTKHNKNIEFREGAIVPETISKRLIALFKNISHDTVVNDTSNEFPSDPCEYSWIDCYTNIIANFAEKSNGKIDYILTFSRNTNFLKEKKNSLKRKMYFHSLLSYGLLLEIVKQEYPTDENIIMFVKIFIPWEIVLLYAERLKLKLPLKGKMKTDRPSIWSKSSRLNKIMSFFTPINDSETCYYGANYLQEFADKFDLTGENAISDAMRISIILELLQRAQFGPEPRKIGLSKMIASEAIDSAYPLHQGPYKKNKIDDECTNDRMWLYENWANLLSFYRCQPLNRIYQYCGTKVAIYFALLGFYTSWLFPVSIISILTCIFGFQSMFTSKVSKDICDSERSGKIILCPPCDQVCDYQYLHNSCTYSYLNSILENEALIAYTIIMSCWAKLFIKFWSRKQRELQFRWEMNNFSEKEGVRPEYEAQCWFKRQNPATNQEEYYMTKGEKTIRYFFSAATVIMIIFLLIVLFIILYFARVALVTILYRHIPNYHAKLVTSILFAIVYLILIILMGKCYKIVALKLTEWERPRTENEFDNRFTFKMFCFSFFSHYLSLFNIAFSKPFFTRAPNSYQYFLPSYRIEECGPTGCLFDVSLEMAIIFGGKRFLFNLWAFLKLKLTNIIRKRRLLELYPEVKDGNEELVAQWEQDIHLCPFDRTNLIKEYLEIVIQYGYVSLFVAAFPLAPLFAFLNNLVEIRMDALKIITEFRRTAGFRARDIGIWMDILRILATLGVITNSAIIGFTSNFIPKLVYKYFYSPNQSLDGFAKFALSEFNIKDFEEHSIPIQSKISPEFRNITTCFYPDYREPHTSHRKYEYSEVFWVISFGRLAFIIVYQHVVLLLSKLFSHVVPEISNNVKVEMQREEYLNEELLFDYRLMYENVAAMSAPH